MKLRSIATQKGVSEHTLSTCVTSAVSRRRLTPPGMAQVKVGNRENWPCLKAQGQRGVDRAV